MHNAHKERFGQQKKKELNDNEVVGKQYMKLDEIVWNRMKLDEISVEIVWNSRRSLKVNFGISIRLNDQTFFAKQNEKS